MPPYIDHVGQVVSTDSAEAAARYAEAVGLLLGGGSPSDAIPGLEVALTADPSLGLALAALAVATAAERSGDVATERSENGRRDLLEAAVATSSSATRRERQHIEIVAAALSGDGPRARALSSEHLAEFPTDLLVAHVVAQHCPVDRALHREEIRRSGEL